MLKTFVNQVMNQITDFDLLLNEYHDLYDDYEKNLGDDPYVSKLKKLEQWKKNIFIMYLACDCKIKTCANMLSCSTNTVRKTINEIKITLQS